MASPETITEQSDSDRGPIPTTAGWQEAPVDGHFSVAPAAPEVLAEFDASAREPTITGASTSRDRLAASQFPAIPGYRILGVLGCGGMGTVYRALHLELNRLVALKIVHPGRDDSTLRARFEREFRSLAAIEHPNIVPVYDAGNSQGFSYFTMRYVPGGALSAHLARFRADPAAGCKLMAKVARAVHHLHESGVLHRDLKPLNILIGDGDEPLVADFGLAKWMDDDSDMTVTGLPMGTRQYMSPEQSLGRKAEYSAACDVWALGIVLYEVVAGHRPFGSEDPVELYTQIRTANPPPMAEFNPAAPAPLEAIARRCLAKKPQDRYASAADLAADLERWLAGDSPTATQLPKPRRARRSWIGVGSAVGILALAVGLFFAFSGQDQKKRSDIPPSPDLPLTKRSIAEQMASGVPVELIGESGMPLVEATPLPGSKERFFVETDGFATLQAVSFGGIELVREEFPLPARLEAEVAWNTRTNESAFFAVYVGRKEWPNLSKPFFSQVQITLREKRLPAANGEPMIRDSAVASVYSGLDGVRATLTDCSSPASIERKVKNIFPSPLAWQPLSITLTADAAQLDWQGKPLPPITAQFLGEMVRGDVRRTRPGGENQIVPPVFGHGCGVCVRGGAVALRNIRLVPLNKPVP